jgi:hypothetical protein
LPDSCGTWGIWKVLRPGVDVEALVRVAVIASDSGRRRFRRGDEISSRLGEMVARALKVARRRLGIPIEAIEVTDAPRERLQPERRPVLAT